jgi:hypothetical protein
MSDKKKAGMDMITSLVGNKIFSSLYDPKSDTLFAEFRKRASEAAGGLKDVVSRGVNTKAILDKIPGVSDSTKNELNKLLAESKEFAVSATNLSPSAILAKKSEIAAKINSLVSTALGEGVDAKKKALQKSKEEKLRKFSFKNVITKMLRILFYLILVILVLWGGSISSNAAIDLPVQMRFYYFIYGAILFPVSFIFAIKRYFTKPQPKYYAILAPLVEGPIENRILAFLLFPFTYTTLFVAPIPVHFVEITKPASEKDIQETIRTNTLTQKLANAAPSTPPVGLPMAPPPGLPIVGGGSSGGESSSLMNLISMNAKA